MISKLLCAGTICALIQGINTQIVIKSQRDSFPKTHELMLADECRKMNEIGEIRVILSELNTLSLQLVDIEISKNPSEHMNEVNEVNHRIQELVKSAKQMLNQEWTSSKWLVSTDWDLTSDQIIAADQRLSDVFVRLKAFELTGLELSGVERSDLYPLVEVRHDSLRNRIRLNLLRKASSLELCQMNSSLIVRGKVNFTFEGKEFQSNVRLAIRPGADYPGKESVTALPTVNDKPNPRPKPSPFTHSTLNEASK